MNPNAQAQQWRLWVGEQVVVYLRRPGRPIHVGTLKSVTTTTGSSVISCTFEEGFGHVHPVAHITLPQAIGWDERQEGVVYHTAGRNVALYCATCGCGTVHVIPSHQRVDLHTMDTQVPSTPSGEDTPPPHRYNKGGLVKGVNTPTSDTPPTHATPITYPMDGQVAEVHLAEVWFRDAKGGEWQRLGVGHVRWIEHTTLIHMDQTYRGERTLSADEIKRLSFLVGGLGQVVDTAIMRETQAVKGEATINLAQDHEAWADTTESPITDYGINPTQGERETLDTNPSPAQRKTEGVEEEPGFPGFH